jgi:hypothetical protein
MRVDFAGQPQASPDQQRQGHPCDAPLNLDAALVSLHSSWLCWRTGLEKYVGTSIGFASSLRHGFVESYHKPFPPQIIQVLLIDKLLPFYKQREMERIRYVSTKPQNLWLCRKKGFQLG